MDVRPPPWSVARIDEGDDPFDAVKLSTPSRSRTVASYWALVRRLIWEVTAMPAVHAPEAPPEPKPIAPPLPGAEPPEPLLVEPPEPLLVEPPEPLLVEPPEPLPDPPEPDEPWGSFIEPVQPMTIVAARIVLQLFMAHLIGASWEKDGGSLGVHSIAVGPKSSATYPRKKLPGKTFVIEKMSFLLLI